MNLDELLTKLKMEYHECIGKLNDAQALLNELQTIKAESNYAKEIADLEVKQKILENPKKAKKEWGFGLKNIFLLIFMFAVTSALGVAFYNFLKFIMGNVWLTIIVAALELGSFSFLLLFDFRFIQYWHNGYKQLKQILASENLIIVTNELINKKEEQKAIDEDIKYYQDKISDLENEIARHFNTYQNIAQVDKLENPLMPVQDIFEEEKGRERMLKHE